jgi:His-Xaa-Ser system protein HxsD
VGAGWPRLPQVSSSPVDGLPNDVVAADVQARSVSLRVEEALYPLSAIYAAAYIFLDRCFVLLDQPDKPGKEVRVTLAWKKGEPDPEALRSLVGEFTNELLSCAWRAKIAEENRALIEGATAQALGGAMGAPSLDDLEKFDFHDEPFEDPLGIAMSWEEKYGKKKGQAAASAKPTGADPEKEPAT